LRCWSWKSGKFYSNTIVRRKKSKALMELAVSQAMSESRRRMSAFPVTSRRNMVTFRGNRGSALRWGTFSVISSRTSALLVAGIASLMALHLSRVSAQWWHRAPVDFEECAEAAGKAATPEEKSSKLADCNSKFAGRRKPGGGYTYYDFMQDRSFDIAGPNPTPEEQKNIDQQYTLYLEKQRRENIAAAFAKQQQLQLEQASLRAETPARVPVPQARRPKPPQQAATAQPAAPHARGHNNTNCPPNTFSCEWPRLSEGLNDIKRLFNSSPTAKAKKS
jgi:hypothetical protein